MADVFISYSRKDLGFVRRLHSRLESGGRTCWVDWDGIPPTAEWMAEIEDALRGANAFLAVLSPDWAESRTCAAETALAVRHGKRIIPVVSRDVDSVEVPSEVSRLNWILCRTNDDFDRGFEQIVRALDIDLAHVKIHARLEMRAWEWNARNRESSLCLRGADLEEAEQWVRQADAKDPQPTKLQKEFITESRRADVKRRGLLLAVSGAVFIVLLAIGIFAIYQRIVANTRGNERDAQAQTALGRKLRTEAETLARKKPGELPLATLLSIEASRLLPGPETEQTLYSLLGLTVRSQVVLNHAKPVLAVAWDSNGASLTSISADGDVRRLRDGQQHVVKTDGIEPTGRGVLSPDGRWAAFEIAPDAVVVLDVEAGREIGRIDLPGPANSIAVSPDGTQLAVTGGGSSVGVWSVRTGTQVHTLSHGENVKRVAFSASDRYLVSVGDDRTHVWSADSGNDIAVLPAGGEYVAFNADETLIAIGGVEGAAVFALPGGAIAARITQYAEVGIDVAKVAFSSTGGVLAMAVGDSLHLWDLSQATPQDMWRVTHPGITMIEFSPDERQIATAGSDNTARIWDAESGRETARLVHRGAVTDFRFNRDGSKVATASDDGSVVLWETVSSWREAVAHENFDFNCAFSLSADANTVVFDDGGSLVVRTVSDNIGNVVTRLPVKPQAALSADGRRLATADYDGTIVVFDVASGREMKRLRPSDQAFDLLFGLTDRYLALHDAGGVRILDVDGASQVMALDAMLQGCHGGDLSLSSTHVAAVLADGAIGVYDLPSGREALRLKPGGAAVALSRDGRLLATYGSPGPVNIIDLRTKQTLLTLTLDAGEDPRLAFSLEGRHLAVGGAGAVRVFNVADGKEVHRSAVSYDIAAVALSPDGSAVLTSRDGSESLQLRFTDPARVLEKACGEVARTLSRDEWQQYLTGLPYKPACPN